MKYDVTKERILEAASKCSTAKETLKTLFPEAFEDDTLFTLDTANYHVFPENSPFRSLFQVRLDGNFGGKSFYLDNSVNWEIVTDSWGQKVLLPTKR